jgi:hypothetical protein
LDGRYKAKLVDGDKYLLALTRYVHLNPVCVGAIGSDGFRAWVDETGILRATVARLEARLSQLRKGARSVAARAGAAN